MSASSEQTLVCRRCDVLSELVREKGQDDAIRCPRCGAVGSREAVVRKAGEYAERQATNKSIDALRNRIAQSASRAKRVNYVPGNRKRMIIPTFVFR